MAFDQTTRNRLQRFVNDARRVLEEEFTRQLQNDYGMDPNAGSVAELASHDAQRETARILRDTLAHYCASGDMDARSGLERIVREQAFTVLNRLAALRMAEARGLLVESVGNGFQAKGFQLYARLAGTGLGETGDAYRVYLFSVFDELAQDLPGLFERYSPQGRLFPREAALLQVLNLINDPGIEALWSEDETIGWIYQYFNSQEERRAMRQASQVPRNSRELAVRNQFFTPRYVVEFLVDNTLGRLWFNATGGATDLRERCQYLLVKPDEAPQAAIKLRDPRTLKLLDPACGSMHFGLYAFDVFAEIYREAWAWERQHGPGSLSLPSPASAREAGGEGEPFKPLSQTYEDEAAFLRDVPRLIIEHNIYGVDIDPRAAQIASLALWLRAQRAWHDAGVKAKDRPLIGRGHVVAAIAPPAERELRQHFARSLDNRDAELFEKTLQLLKGLPELGVLLQVERELPHLIRQVYVGKGTGLFAQQEQESWQLAERRLRAALIEFSQAAKSTYQGRLFAQDALQGLRMIDVCRESFNVVLMNPPFGLPSVDSGPYINENYPGAHNDIYCTFVSRALNLCRSGYVGCITSSSFLLSPRLEAFRTSTILPNLVCVADFGLGVMDDAMVRAAAYVLGESSSGSFLAADCKGVLRDLQAGASSSALLPRFSEVKKGWFAALPQSRLLLDAPQDVRELLAKGPYFEPVAGTAREGMKTFDNERFIRLPWEIDPSKIGPTNNWRWLSKGGEFSFFFSDIHLLLNWRDDGAELKQVNISLNGSTAQVRQASTYWGLRGTTYSRRSSGFSARAFPEGCIFTSNGPAILPLNDTDPLYLLGWVNSRPIRAFTHLNAGAYDNYSTGALKKLPWKAPTTEQANQLAPEVERAVVAAKIEYSQTDECSRWFSGFIRHYQKLKFMI
ncbi:MAG: BREX-1 system adenine-specific DNA-methyltransferase PglX [Candidatus Competibacteraceae bacterium]|nr:BREX-1 system adenine-specific DNA-methyltransferase PglX [Candidatus Competibacteraceae bacterium]